MKVCKDKYLTSKFHMISLVAYLYLFLSHDGTVKGS